MLDIGKEIRKSREQQQLSIDHVANNINISKHNLISIEKNDFNSLPGDPYNLAYIKQYCEFLEIEKKLFVNQYKSLTQVKKEKEIILPKPIESLYFKYFGNVLTVFVFMFLATSFYFFFLKENTNNFEFAMTPKIPESLLPELEKENLLTSQNINLPSENLSEDNKLLSNQVINNGSAIASNDIQSIDDIILFFKADTWIQIKDENSKVIISKLIRKGQEYILNPNNTDSFTTGNAGNILVKMGQKDFGPLGLNGEVINSINLNKVFLVK